MKIEAIYLDMDGVLADFVTASLGAACIPLTHKTVTEWDYFQQYMSEKEFWSRIDKCEGFWFNLKQYEWAGQLANFCRNIAPVIYCSSPSLNPDCASAKIQWLRENGLMGWNENNYILTKYKDHLASPTRVLIDDSPHNLQAFAAAGGIAIQFPQPWNTNIQSQLDDPFKHVQDHLINIIEKDEQPAIIRSFDTGATRNIDTNKLDFEGFLSPTVLESFAEYMHGHRTQKDGTVRDSDNWQKGIPIPVYMKSMFRHFFDVWKMHRGLKAFSPDDGHELTMEEGLNAMLFNVQGYQHEHLKQKTLSNA